jgi:hypothetical protein
MRIFENIDTELESNYDKTLANSNVIRFNLIIKSPLACYTISTKRGKHCRFTLVIANKGKFFLILTFLHLRSLVI